MSTPQYHVTRAHLKKACEQQNWDLLDKLLAIDDRYINDNALFTDDWGEWWGMLYECVRREQLDGVRVLLARGAKRKVSAWGDGLALSVMELAAEKPVFLALLKSKEPVSYVRRSEPELPDGTTTTAVDKAINRQGEIRDQTGLVFPHQGLE